MVWLETPSGCISELLLFAYNCGHFTSQFAIPLEKKLFETEFLMYQKCSEYYFQLLHCPPKGFLCFHGSSILLQQHQEFSSSDLCLIQYIWYFSSSQMSNPQLAFIAPCSATGKIHFLPSNLQIQTFSTVQGKLIWI